MKPWHVLALIKAFCLPLAVLLILSGQEITDATPANKVLANSALAGPKGQVIKAVSPEQLKKAYHRPTSIPFPADNAYTKEREALGRTLTNTNLDSSKERKR